MTAVIMPSLSLGRLDGALTSFTRRTPVADRLGGHVCGAGWQHVGRPSGRAAINRLADPGTTRAPGLYDMVAALMS
jgi:hypothetical protein